MSTKSLVVLMISVSIGLLTCSLYATGHCTSTHAYKGDPGDYRVFNNGNKSIRLITENGDSVLVGAGSSCDVGLIGGKLNILGELFEVQRLDSAFQASPTVGNWSVSGGSPNQFIAVDITNAADYHVKNNGPWSVIIKKFDSSGNQIGHDITLATGASCDFGVPQGGDLEVVWDTTGPASGTYQRL